MNTQFSCDPYNYDKDLLYAINVFKDEYMAQYEKALW